jgi:hypothetical protein
MTIGFPHTVAGLGWIEEVIESRSRPVRRCSPGPRIEGGLYTEEAARLKSGVV